MQSVTGGNKILEAYQLSSQYPSIPENEVPIPQYSHNPGQTHSQAHLFQEPPPVYHEMPANMPIELPADLDTIRTTSTNNIGSSQNDQNNQNDPTLNAGNKLLMPYPPPAITTVYGDVAGGNPYADDDTLATPTPTKEVRNGISGVGYIGYSGRDQGTQGSSRNSGHEFINDALLQLRFVDDPGEGASGEHSHTMQSGFGTAL